MTDRLAPAHRSENMRRIRSKDTKPELVVRRLVHGLGFRYRLHDRKLPGCPDLVFARKRKIIQVYGCYWHPHGTCRLSHTPQSRQEYWGPKLTGNHARDEANIAKLRSTGWRVLVIRECQTADSERLKLRITKFLAEATART